MSQLYDALTARAEELESGSPAKVVELAEFAVTNRQRWLEDARAAVVNAEAKVEDLRRLVTDAEGVVVGLTQAVEVAETEVAEAVAALEEARHGLPARTATITVTSYVNAEAGTAEAEGGVS